MYSHALKSSASVHCVPGPGNFWLATEYIPGNGDLVANWANRIFEVVA